MSVRKKEKKTSSPKTKEQNVVNRVENLSLASSTSDARNSCATTKDSHPVVKSDCNTPEKGIEKVAAEAVEGGQPVQTKPAPEMAAEITKSVRKKEKKVSSPKTKEQNVVTRVANSSLASSTADASNSCAATKDSDPVVKSDCNTPENGIEMVAAAAVEGGQPVQTKQAPQRAAEITMSVRKKEKKVSSPKTKEQNVVAHVADSSLASSTADASNSCAATKDSDPVVKSDCNTPEKGIEKVVTATVEGGQPVQTKPAPQMAAEVTRSVRKKERKVSSPKTKDQELQNVITRVANLSLAGSTPDARTPCAATKDSHLVIIADCNVPVKDIERVATAAIEGRHPVQTRLAPQMAAEIARSVRKKERKVSSPKARVQVLQVISENNELSSTTVTSMEEAIRNAIARKRNTVARGKNVAPETAQGSGEATKSTAVKSTVDQKRACFMSSTLPTLETWKDSSLPVGGQQMVWLTSCLEELVAANEEQEDEASSYSVRLGMVPTYVRQRFVGKMKASIQNIQDALFHLQITFDLVEYSKRSVDQQPDIQEELKKVWLTWSMAELEGDDKDSILKTETTESRILLVFRYLIQRLRTGCVILRFNTQGLPRQVKERIQKLESIIDGIQTYSYAAASFQTFPDNMLQLSRLSILKARMLLHDLLDYVVENVILTTSVDPLEPFKSPAQGAQGTEKTKQPSGPQSK